MDLKDTIELMQSKDYRDRLKAEYYQTKIRYEKLNEMLKKAYDHELDFELPCPKDLYNSQLHFMKCYLEMLETRARVEGIKF